jgi:hypothetical protein
MSESGGQQNVQIGPASASSLLSFSSGSVAAAPAVATLPAAPGKTNFVTGIEVTGAGATAASVVIVTITGLSNTLHYILDVPAGAVAQLTPLIIPFSPPLPGSAVNTAVSVNVPSLGAGNTNAAAVIHGFAA